MLHCTDFACRSSMPPRAASTLGHAPASSVLGGHALGLVEDLANALDLPLDLAVGRKLSRIGDLRGRRKVFVWGVVIILAGLPLYWYLRRRRRD